MVHEGRQQQPVNFNAILIRAYRKAIKVNKVNFMTSFLMAFTAVWCSWFFILRNNFSAANIKNSCNWTLDAHCNGKHLMMSNFLTLFIHNCRGNVSILMGKFVLKSQENVMSSTLKRARGSQMKFNSSSWMETLSFLLSLLFPFSLLMSCDDFDADCITFQFIFTILAWFTIQSCASKTSDMSINKVRVKHKQSFHHSTLITERKTVKTSQCLNSVETSKDTSFLCDMFTMRLRCWRKSEEERWADAKGSQDSHKLTFHFISLRNELKSKI